MLREHEEAFESHIFDPAAASAYKENRHSLRMAATQGTLTSEQNIFGNIAQLAERLAVNQEVVGSSPSVPAHHGTCASAVIQRVPEEHENVVRLHEVPLIPGY